MVAASRSRLVSMAGLALATAMAATGCGSINQGRSAAIRQARAVPQVAGVWEGIFRSTLGEGIGNGDTRIERQAWELTQSGGRISGFYLLELTMISGDGRPYLCSREPRFSTLLRFDVTGRAAPGGIELEEIGDVQARGPCRPAFHSPARYRASVNGDVLTLVDDARKMTLYRRGPGSDGPALGAGSSDHSGPDWSSEPAFPTFESVRGDAAAEPLADIAGTWLWENRGTIPSGDEKAEREEWHLVQDGRQVTGYYDRAVRQTSTDGHAYRCNSALDFRVVTRFQVTGEIRGSEIVLYERSYEILEASPCDDGRRRLDAYQGRADNGEIRLLWGVGAQVLRRVRPNVPTQRF